MITAADFNKCFNSVNFMLLIGKLLRLGTDKSLVCLIITIFTGCRIYYKIDEYLSVAPGYFNLNCGHQGSVVMP